MCECIIYYIMLCYVVMLYFIYIILYYIVDNNRILWVVYLPDLRRHTSQRMLHFTAWVELSTDRYGEVVEW
jgi:hypothetical protein